MPNSPVDSLLQLLPSKVTQEDGEKTISLRYRAMYKEETLEKIIVFGEDITSLMQEKKYNDYILKESLSLIHI